MGLHGEEERDRQGTATATRLRVERREAIRRRQQAPPGAERAPAHATIAGSIAARFPDDVAWQELGDDGPWPGEPEGLGIV